jgi:hypothetical protein
MRILERATLIMKNCGVPAPSLRTEGRIRGTLGTVSVRHLMIEPSQPAVLSHGESSVRDIRMLLNT